jgi:hypothetical protein
MSVLFNGDSYRFENFENQFHIDIPKKAFYLLAVKTSGLNYLCCFTVLVFFYLHAMNKLIA